MNDDREQHHRLRAYRLAPAFVLLSWDSAEARRARHVRVRVGDAGVRGPVCGCSVDLMNGKVRNVVVLQCDATESEGALLTVADLDGTVLAADETTGFALPSFDGCELLEGARSNGAPRLLRFLLETCPAVLRSAVDATWAATCRDLVRDVAGPGAPLVPRCGLLDQFVCCDGLVSAGLGERLTAVVLDGSTIKTTPVAPGLADVPAKKGKRLFHVLVDTSTDAARTLVVFGEGGAASRVLAQGSAAQAPAPWPVLAGGTAARVSRRRYVLAALAQLAGRDERAATLARDLNVLSARTSRTDSAAVADLGFQVDLILAANGGVFVTGRLDDPHAVADRLEIERLGQVRAQALDEVVRFPVAPSSIAAASGAQRAAATGFAAFMPTTGGAPEAPCRVALRLKSGLSLPAVSGPRPASPAEARDAVLAAVPAPFLDDRAIETCIEPMLRAQQSCGSGTGRPPIVLPIGPVDGTPDVSIVVPVGRHAEILRCRASRLALGGEAHRLELVYLLQRAEQVAAVERLLRDLRICYGLPTRLLVFSGDTTATAAVDAGVAAARGRYVLLCGPGDVPLTADWLSTMLAELQRSSPSGAVGAARRSAAGSAIACVGDVGQDLLGRWRLAWTHPGLPGDLGLPPAPLFVSSRALLMSREAFDAVDGFDPAYLDYTCRDADFCRKLLASGRGLAHLGTAAAFVEFEQPPAPLPAELMEIGRELDRRRFERRWRVSIEALRAETGLRLAASSSAPPANGAGRGGKRRLASAERRA